VVLPEDDVADDDGVGAALARDFEEFAAPHGEKECHVDELVKRPQQWARGWAPDHALEDVEREGHLLLRRGV
jgi:hypothetical protein